MEEDDVFFLNDDEIIEENDIEIEEDFIDKNMVKMMLNNDQILNHLTNLLNIKFNKESPNKIPDAVYSFLSMIDEYQPKKSYIPNYLETLHPIIAANKVVVVDEPEMIDNDMFTELNDEWQQNIRNINKEANYINSANKLYDITKPFKVDTPTGFWTYNPIDAFTNDILNNDDAKFAPNIRLINEVKINIGKLSKNSSDKPGCLKGLYYNEEDVIMTIYNGDKIDVVGFYNKVDDFSNIEHFDFEEYFLHLKSLQIDDKIIAFYNGIEIHGIIKNIRTASFTIVDETSKEKFRIKKNRQFIYGPSWKKYRFNKRDLNTHNIKFIGDLKTLGNILPINIIEEITLIQNDNMCGRYTNYRRILGVEKMNSISQELKSDFDREIIKKTKVVTKKHDKKGVKEDVLSKVEELPIIVLLNNLKTRILTRKIKTGYLPPNNEIVLCKIYQSVSNLEFDNNKSIFFDSDLDPTDYTLTDEDPEDLKIVFQYLNKKDREFEIKSIKEGKRIVRVNDCARAGDVYYIRDNKDRWIKKEESIVDRDIVSNIDVIDQLITYYSRDTQFTNIAKLRRPITIDFSYNTQRPSQDFIGNDEFDYDTMFDNVEDFDQNSTMLSNIQMVNVKNTELQILLKSMDLQLSQEMVNLIEFEINKEYNLADMIKIKSDQIYQKLIAANKNLKNKTKAAVDVNNIINKLFTERVGVYEKELNNEYIVNICAYLVIILVLSYPKFKIKRIHPQCLDSFSYNLQGLPDYFACLLKQIGSPNDKKFDTFTNQPLISISKQINDRIIAIRAKIIEFDIFLTNKINQPTTKLVDLTQYQTLNTTFKPILDFKESTVANTNIDRYLKELALKEPPKYESILNNVHHKKFVSDKKQDIRHQSFQPIEIIGKNEKLDIFSENEIIIKNGNMIVGNFAKEDEVYPLSVLYNKFVEENKGFDPCDSDNESTWIGSLFSNKIHSFDPLLKQWLINMREVDPYVVQSVLQNLLVSKMNILFFKNSIKDKLNVQNIKKFNSLDVREVNIVMTYIVSQIIHRHPKIKNEIQTEIINSINMNRDDTEMLNKKVEELREKSKQEKMKQYHNDKDIRKMQRQLDEYGMTLEMGGQWVDGDKDVYGGENPDVDDGGDKEVYVGENPDFDEE